MIAGLEVMLFDVDDTLFDRRRAQREAVRLIVREMRDIFTGIDEEAITDAFLESDRMTMEEFYAGASFVDELRVRRGRVFLRLLGLSEAYAEEVSVLYVKLYPAVDTPVPGAKSVLERLAAGFQLGVVSNGAPDVQYRKLEALGIHHLLDCVVLSEELGIRKPEPGIFWEAAGLLGREPEACLYVGNSYQVDVVGAKRAGMWACWFNPEGLPSAQASAEPDYEVRALGEILGIVM